MNVSIGDVIDPITPVWAVAQLYVHSVYMNQKIVFVKIKMTVVTNHNLKTFDEPNNISISRYPKIERFLRIF